MRQAIPSSFPGDAFAATLELACRQRLRGKWRLVAATGQRAVLALIRNPDGTWRLRAGAATVTIDELAVGALAARHLAALGARDLRYVGPAIDSLRWRGFAIAAGALGLAAGRLDRSASTDGDLGIFADGEAAEALALTILAGRGLSVPRDALLLGIEDGSLPAPSAPGLSRLRFDPAQIAAAALTAIRERRGGSILMAPTGVLTRASSDHAANDPQLAAALAHLSAHLHQPLDVPILARAAGLPRRSLERLFAAVLGHSPLAEIRRQRVLRAQELLSGSDLSLERIAQRCGFSGADRLGVVFRQMTGCSPGAWRRQHQRQPDRPS